MGRLADNPLSSCMAELQAAPHVWVAYSGGMDSSLLLNLAAEVIDPKSLTALHINHGISPEADRWEDHCRSETRRLGIGFQSERVRVPLGANLEANAREARYQIFERFLGRNDLLLMAHHADDQAETLIFRMMRGAGLRGLSAMPRKRKLGAGVLLRPLLDMNRNDLKALAVERQLSWIEDPSNADTRHSRNFIRHEVIARLQSHWPAAIERINQSVNTLAQAQTLLEEYADSLIQGCDLRSEAFGQSLDLQRFNLLGESHRQLLLRQMLAERGEHPDERRLAELMRQLQSADSESHIADIYQHAEVRVYRSRLYLLTPLGQFDDQQVYAWDGAGELVIAGVGLLMGLTTEPCAESYEIRFRQTGERCKPLERDRSRSLKRLLQEYAVPPWLRERVPLIYQGEMIVAVPGLFSCSASVPVPRLVWE